MIVNEPLGAAEYDESKPFGCLYHGLIRYDRINNEYYLTLPDGTRKKCPFPLDWRKASQIFDLHRPITSTPQEMLDEGMKAENYAIINHGVVCGQQIEGTIYHSETIGNWVVKIEGKAYIPENKADITLTFTPFGVLGEDARTVFTQQIHLDDIGQADLRQKVHAKASVVYIPGIYPYSTYIGDDVISDGTHLSYLTINPTYASRTGRRVAIGIPAVSLGGGAGIIFGSYQFPIQSATWLAWLLLDISDQPATGLQAAHPIGSISLLYNRSDSLGFTQTKFGGDYWSQENHNPVPYPGAVNEQNYPPPEFLNDQCSKGSTYGPFLFRQYQLGVVYKSDSLSNADGEGLLFENGFIDRVTAIYFDDDENPTPVFFTSYQLQEPIFEVHDDSISGDFQAHTDYSCSDCNEYFCRWRGRSYFDFSGSGTISYTHGSFFTKILRLKLGADVLLSFGKKEKNAETKTYSIKPYSHQAYNPYALTPVTELNITDDSGVLTQEKDGDIPISRLEGRVIPFSYFEAFPRPHNQGTPFQEGIAFSAMTTAYNMMYLIPTGQGHCLILTNFVPIYYGQIPPTDAIAYIIDSKGGLTQAQIPRTQPLSSVYPWQTPYSLEQVFSAVANPMTEPTSTDIQTGDPDDSLIGYT